MCCTTVVSLENIVLPSRTHLTMAADKVLELFTLQARVVVQICRALPEEDATDDDIMLISQTDTASTEETRASRKCSMCLRNQASERCSNFACGKCCLQPGNKECIHHGTAAQPSAKKHRTREPEDYDDERLRALVQRSLTAA